MAARHQLPKTKADLRKTERMPDAGRIDGQKKAEALKRLRLFLSLWCD